MKVLITGFDPFGGAAVNPAYEAVKLLPDELGGNEIIKKEIPTVFGKDEEVLRKAIEEYSPDAVICVGQAGGRSGMTVEKVAVNLMEARIPDNAGNQPFDVPVKEDGETSGEKNGTGHERSSDTGTSLVYGRNICVQRYYVPSVVYD